jgi:hypothetical protein
METADLRYAVSLGAVVNGWREGIINNIMFGKILSIPGTNNKTDKSFCRPNW